jgi:transposase
METSLLYHMFSLHKQEHCSTFYKDKSIYFTVQTKTSELCCPKCGKRHVVKNGVVVRQFLSVPVGHKRTYIIMRVQKIICKNCGYHGQEYLPFSTGKRTYTNQFARYVVGLSRIGTIKDVAGYLHVHWSVVKDIQKRHLKIHFGRPDISQVKNIGIDEFAVRKGHVYKTIVADLDTGRIIYVGEGKGADSLDKFWKRVRRNSVTIENVATDLSSAFISSVIENAPEATHVFDHFHVVKLMNDAIDEIRRDAYNEERNINKRNVLKGTRWLLLRNERDIMDRRSKNRLENALRMNKPLAAAYYLKESLKEIWMQANMADAEDVLKTWCRQAYDSHVAKLVKMANTILAHRTGILAWYNCNISTAKVEGINNKIKTMKRIAYGYRDDEFFKLKLYSLHDKISSFT